MSGNLSYFLEITGTIVLLAIVLMNPAGFSSVVTSGSALFNKVVSTLQGR